VICYDRQGHHLGNFNTKQEAALAYDREARQLGGGGKPLNYESIEIVKVVAAQAQAEYAITHSQQPTPAPLFKTRCQVHNSGAVVG
jgi:hypothetical protein